MKQNISKNAVITGAANGIGKAIATELLCKGYNLALIDKDGEGLEKIKGALNKSSKIFTFNIDITKTDKLEKCIVEIKNKFPTIHILVNNAGILKNGLLEIPFEEFYDMLDTHLIASYHLIRGIAPLMQKQKNGYIFNIASQSGKRARSKLGAYSISKFALIGLNEALYEEMMRDNVKVTALCPSVTDTNLTTDEEFEKGDKIPVSDIVSTILYLLNLGNNVFIKEICLDCKVAFLKKLDLRG